MVLDPKLSKIIDEVISYKKSTDAYFVEPILVSDTPEKIERMMGDKFVGVSEFLKKNTKTSLLKSFDGLLYWYENKSELYQNKEDHLLDCIRFALCIATEGVSVGMFEGITKLKIVKTNNSNYLSLYSEGPIRGLGGTMQGLAVMFCDYLREKSGIGKYIISPLEKARWLEERDLYNTEHARLQYLPGDEELEKFLEFCPIQLNSIGIRGISIVKNKGVLEIGHEDLRGGSILIVCEGVLQKKKKLASLSKTFQIPGWDWLTELGTIESTLDEEELLFQEDEGEEDFGEEYKGDEREKIVGRPILGWNDVKGSIRIRLGTSRFTGLLSVGMNPITSLVLGNFFSLGTQVKYTYPAKGGVITPCPEIDAPFVLLNNGVSRRLTIEDKENIIIGKIKILKVFELGEILISPGEFFENNSPLPNFGQDPYYFNFIIGDRPSETYLDNLSLLEGGLGISPERIFFIENMKGETFNWIRTEFSKITKLDTDLHILEFNIQKYNVFKKILLPFAVISQKDIFSEGSEQIFLNESDLFLRTGLFFRFTDRVIEDICLNFGIDYSPEVGLIFKEKIYIDPIVDEDGLAKFLEIPKYKFRNNQRIGLRMGRPEKAKAREKSNKASAPHSLITSSRLNRTRDILKEGVRKVDGKKLICDSCSTDGDPHFTVLNRCFLCGSPTRLYLDELYSENLDIGNLFRMELEKNDLPTNSKIKGALAAGQLIFEDPRKGVLRYKHDLLVFRDGTSRFDATNVPMSHFYPEEINLTVKQVLDLGYSVDYLGNPIDSITQLIPLKIGDIIISKKAIEFFKNELNFLSELYPDMPLDRSLIGRYVVSLAPHIASGIIGRVIGYIDYSVCLAHPAFHAQKRRNADGDEDSIFLLEDYISNFSPRLLQVRLGGTMDTPLTTSYYVIPHEVEKEFFSIYSSEDPYLDYLNFSEKDFLSFTKSKNILANMDDEVFERNCHNLKFMYHVGNITNLLPERTAYKETDNMKDKLNKELEIMKLCEGTPISKILGLILEGHLLPDIYGNYKKYTNQRFRCGGCGKKWDNVPLFKTCPCGKNLIMTIHRGGILKYVGLVEELSKEYNLSPYIKSKVNSILSKIYTSLD